MIPGADGKPVTYDHSVVFHPLDGFDIEPDNMIAKET